MKRVLLLALATGAMLLAGCGSGTQETQSTQQSTQNMQGGNMMQWSAPPQMSIDRNKEYTATMKTNYGTITIQLLPKEAPLAVNNFVFLSRQGFYNGTKFHRIMSGFMMQGGDPTGTGTGGPGYRFADERVTRDYLAGTLAMANAGPNTNGSQFFIMFADYPLSKNYTIFGQVTGGMDIVKKIEGVKVTADPRGEMSRPTDEVKIESVTIAEK